MGLTELALAHLQDTLETRFEPQAAVAYFLTVDFHSTLLDHSECLGITGGQSALAKGRCNTDAFGPCVEPEASTTTLAILGNCCGFRIGLKPAL